MMARAGSPRAVSSSSTLRRRLEHGGLGCGRHGLRDVTVPMIHDGAWQEGHEEKDHRRGARVEPHQLREGPAPAIEEPGPDHVGAAEGKVAGAHHERETETLATAWRGAHGEVHQGQLRPDADEAAQAVDEGCGP